MKLFRAILTLPLLLGLLYACNDDDKKVISDPKENENNNSVDETTDNKNNTNTNTTTNDTEQTSVKVADVNYAFTEFDLDVEYENDNSYEVEYENDGNYIYAKLKDGPINVTHKGDKAYERLVDPFKQLTFDETTSDEDVRKEVIKAFNLEDNYQSFELEVKFQNGEEKHYNHKK